jgi:hypothetical protein
VMIASSSRLVRWIFIDHSQSRRLNMTYRM